MDFRGVILEVILRSESEEIPTSVSESILGRFLVFQKDHFGKRAPRAGETHGLEGRQMQSVNPQMQSGGRLAAWAEAVGGE